MPILVVSSRLQVAAKKIGFTKIYVTNSVEVENIIDWLIKFTNSEGKIYEC